MKALLTELFGLSPEEAHALAGLWTRRPFSPGSEIIGQSCESESLLLILAGEVSLVTASGSHVRLGPGQILGEVAWLTKRGHTASVVAETEGELAVLDYHRITQLEREEPAIALCFVKGLARTAALRLLDDYASTGDYVALVAHDGCKEQLVAFLAAHEDFFSGRELVATAASAALIEEGTSLRVLRKVASGPLGGDQEIGSMISRGVVSTVFFFRNPLAPWAHQADIDALMDDDAEERESQGGEDTPEASPETSTGDESEANTQDPDVDHDIPQGELF